MTTPIDDRSGIDSQGSQRISTSMTQERAQIFGAYLLKPEQVNDLWEAENPNEAAQRLILAHVENVSEQTGEDWRSWDENEDRFEPNELKWIADFAVRNLVFIKTDL